MVALLAFRQPEDLKFQILEQDSIMLGRAALFQIVSMIVYMAVNGNVNSYHA